MAWDGVGLLTCHIAVQSCIQSHADWAQLPVSAKHILPSACMSH